MKPGPKATPPELKVLHGNTDKKAAIVTAQLEPVLPEPLDWLGEAAVEEWDRLAPHLYEHGLLTDADVGTFAMLCQCYGEWIECERYLKDNGLTQKAPSGYEQQRPEVGIRNKARETYYRMGSAFGLTPSDRGRIALPAAGKKRSEADSLKDARRARMNG